MLQILSIHPCCLLAPLRRIQVQALLGLGKKLPFGREGTQEEMIVLEMRGVRGVQRTLFYLRSPVEAEIRAYPVL